jgi:hypothetical protein
MWPGATDDDEEVTPERRMTPLPSPCAAIKGVYSSEPDSSSDVLEFDSDSRTMGEAILGGDDVLGSSSDSLLTMDETGLGIDGLALGAAFSGQRVMTGDFSKALGTSTGISSLSKQNR